ncbi:MAG: hypothetical protein AB7O62_09220 [Pirellulales bacterium]
MSRNLLTSLSVCLALAAAPAQACPFCTGVEPTLTQRREAAAVVALAELIESNAAGRTYRLHKVTQGADRLHGQETLLLPAETALKAGGLALLLGEESDDAALSWTAEPLTETAVAYVFRAPSLRQAAEERLRYFAPFLEHADPAIAEDAYREFGHAPYDQVAQTVDALPQDRMCDWLVDVNVPQQRKGFYGLALGLAQDPAQRQAHAQFLRGLIETPADDFRAGFDGILGGYLVAAGVPALELIEQKYLANPQAADGDVRHAVTALRFYHEYGHGIPGLRLAQAMRHLLARPEFAAAAIADLSRWEDWDSLAAVVSLFGKEGYSARGIRQAIAAYVLTCPTENAAASLAQLREQAPLVVADAERLLDRP